MAFSRYRKNAAEEDSTHKFPQVRFSGVKLNGNKKQPLHTCHLDAILRSL